MKSALSRSWVLMAAFAVTALAQTELDPALLGKPPVDAWPTYHGDYSGRHYSTLNQINQSTREKLGTGVGLSCQSEPAGCANWRLST